MGLENTVGGASTGCLCRQGGQRGSQLLGLLLSAESGSVKAEALGREGGDCFVVGVVLHVANSGLRILANESQ